MGGAAATAIAAAAPQSATAPTAPPLLRQADRFDRLSDKQQGRANHLDDQAVELLRQASELGAGMSDGTDATDASGDDTITPGDGGADDGTIGDVGDTSGGNGCDVSSDDAATCLDDTSAQITDLVEQATTLLERASAATALANRADGQARSAREQAIKLLSATPTKAHTKSIAQLTRARGLRTKSGAAIAASAHSLDAAYGADGVLDEDAVDAADTATALAQRLDTRADSLEAAALRLAA